MSNTLIWDVALGTSPATWQAAFGTEINSLASGSYALSSIIIDNTTGLLTDGTISVALGSVAPSASGASLAFYWQPLNQDGTSYGDGTPTGSVVPVQNYIGSISWPTSATASALTGFLQVERIVPATSFKLGVVNLLGSALAASGNTIQVALNKLNLNG
jgi:hypothetical protein